MPRTLPPKDQGSRARAQARSRIGRALQCDMLLSYRIAVLFVILSAFAGRSSCSRSSSPSSASIPRTADGKPDLQGIWQVRNRPRPTSRIMSRVMDARLARASSKGGPIPYQPWAAAKKVENAKNRLTADPLANCYLPGVPRIMYMEFPFQIFQTPDHIAMTFEWSQVHRTIYTNGAPAPRRHRFLDGRLARPLGGRHAGRRCREPQRPHVVRHGRQLSQRGAAPGRALHDARRQHDHLRGHDRGSEGLHQAVDDQHAAAPPDGCRSHLRVSMSGGSGGSQRRVRTGCEDVVSRTISPPCRSRPTGRTCRHAWKAPAPKGEIKRLADGKPDLQGYFMPDGGGANYGLGKHDGRLPDARRPWRDRGSPGWQPPDAGVGKGRSREPQDARARLRRSHGALLRGGSAALDVRAVAASDPAAARLRRHPARAHVVAHDPARRTPASAGPSAAVAGRLDRPLGRRYAGRRDDKSQWEGVVERGGRGREPRRSVSSSD